LGKTGFHPIFAARNSLKEMKGIKCVKREQKDGKGVGLQMNESWGGGREMVGGKVKNGVIPF